MSKRQLDSRYKDLVDYVNERKHCKGLGDILSEAIKEGKQNHYDGSNLWSILFNLYVTALDDTDFVDLTRTIVDIYNNNYELAEAESYWRFKELEGFDRHDLYFGTIGGNVPLIVDIEQNGVAKKCTKLELNEYLRDTELTADNFTTVEEIDNDQFSNKVSTGY